MDQEVAKTLGELERKLSELERTLTEIGRSEVAENAVATTTSAQPPSSSRVVDEATEPSPTPATAIHPPHQSAAGWPEASTPAHPAPSDGAMDAQPPLDAQPPPRSATDHLLDRARPSGASEARPSGASEARAPTDSELLRFRERLERAVQELTNEYDELLGHLSYAAVPTPTPTPTPTGPTISFARGAPSLDIVDVDGLRDAAVRAFESDPGGMTAYGTSVGYPRLRAWIADHHGVEPERVLVTNGSMQADAFLFEHLVQAGDEVVVERPTYDRTLLSLRQWGARLHAVQMQSDGIDTDALAELLTGTAAVRPKLAHIIPNFQNPAGYTLSQVKRETLLELAAEHRFIVFEDDPYRATRFSGESLPTMLSMDPERVVYASSFSKTVCPGIRVGYLVGSPDLIVAVAKLATNTYISPSMVSQAIVYEFCASGAIERSIQTVKAALAQRAATLAAALRRELPEAEFVEPQGGYFMWVTLPESADVDALFAAAAARGVAFVKGTDFVLDGGRNTLRLAYSGVTPEQIEEGVSRLAGAYRSLR